MPIVLPSGSCTLGFDSLVHTPDILSLVGIEFLGRPFISNPDLVEKFKDHKELQDPHPDTFYTPGKEGYTDY